ncbi:MAG TPA: aminoglycoside phosphotransferase family protein [Rugosimonospora sp.]
MTPQPAPDAATAPDQADAAPDRAGTASAAVDAAVAVARRLGLGATIEPVILREGANLTVHLSPYPIVARIATATAEVRSVEAYQSRELAILDHLATIDAPAIHPAQSVPAGPHEVDGWRLILLHYYDHDPDRPLSGRTLGESLAALHDAMAGLDVELPDLMLPSHVAALDEVPVLLERAATLAAGDRAFLSDRARDVSGALRGYPSGIQPLHGDVHLGNVLRTPDGPVWGDFEDACAGPVEWDLASLLASTQIQTANRDLAEEAVRTYGCDTTTELWRACLEGNVLVFTAWAALAAVHSDRAAATMPRRLAWHREYGGGRR